MNDMAATVGIIRIYEYGKERSDLKKNKICEEVM